MQYPNIVRLIDRQRGQHGYCEPDNSPLLGSGIAQQRDMHGAPAVSHPGFRPHLMQGWTPDFIPKLVDGAVSLELIDRLIPIKGADALRLSRELARQEGIFTGISGGATFSGALQVCADAAPGSTVLCMLPDTGERYLSTVLFEDIPAEMTEEEIEISRSTPLCRFDEPAESDTGESEPEPESLPVTAEAVAFVEQAIDDPDNPVVMFSLEWCEFCWSIRKMFSNLDIPYRSVDLDSAEYQPDDWGGKIRAALIDRTRFPTIPQIFIGGQFVGGCTDLFNGYRAGSVRQLLAENGVTYKQELDVDPYRFLPTWLHPR